MTYDWQKKTDEERRAKMAKIAEMRERLVSVPYKVQLDRIMWNMTHCHKCEAEFAWGAEVCEHCGEELMEHGKQ